MSQESLVLTGVRQNNLKSINLTVEHDQLIALTGISGSGKSSLAFETIYAEGGRRYIETFSPYTRQFLDRLDRPDADVISGVRPALALEQRNRIANSRSTVGTLTEINDYLKLIWAHLSTLFCGHCGKPVISGSPTQILDSLPTLDQRTMIAISFPISFSGESSLESFVQTLSASGLVRYFSERDQKIRRLDDLLLSELATNSNNELLIVVDRIAPPRVGLGEQLSSSNETGTETDRESRHFRSRFATSLMQAYRFGGNRAELLFLSAEGEQKLIRQTSHALDYRCADCNITYSSPRPSQFTFNSPLGACPTCHGFGFTLAVDPNLCVPDPSLSINQGALACWASPSTRHELKQLKNFCDKQQINRDTPWHLLSEAERLLIFGATKKKDGFRGVYSWFSSLESKKYKLHVRVFLSRHRSQYLCKQCGGTRLRPEAMLFKVNGLRLPDLWKLPIGEALEFFKQVERLYPTEEVTESAVSEVLSRLQFLVDIGLYYLTLDRQSRTLSGGEVQRVNLTTFLGTRLVNTMLVLDEPSIGLHPRDSSRLIKILNELRDRGNTVFVVEHDTEIIRACDQVIDLGPAAGEGGGQIVFQGTPEQLARSDKSLTARYMSHRHSEIGASSLQPNLRLKPQPSVGSAIKISGARAHNLKSIDVEIPTNQLVIVSGVSGSGKSSLVFECLTKPYEKLRNGVPLKLLLADPDATIQGLEGLEQIDDIVSIDQSPVGTTPRSNAATYTKAWDIMREALAATEQAVSLGLSKSTFSFNVDGGRCPVCKGAGYERVEMQFLADAFVKCGSCNGRRFKDQVLGVKLGGKNVAELLNLTLSETAELFNRLGDNTHTKEILRRITPLINLGLGYLRLGQPLSELSGGEAQRVKLAAYLSEVQQRRLLFVLDEPTTGLHPHDIEKLLFALRSLIGQGHSVLCIEHNLFVISKADYLIDLGPEAGEAGGQIVASGPLQILLANKESQNSSYTLRSLVAEPNFRAVRPKTKRATSSTETQTPIVIRGARHHNLKNISLDIPKNKLIVMTGVSGSGKSSLAFDILFAEGQRRYIDCLSPYAKQFVTLLQRADVDLVDSIPPTVAISQKTAPPLGVSTIATTTEVYQYLRLLYAKLGEQRCPDHNLPIANLSPSAIADELLKSYTGKRVFIFAPVVTNRKGSYAEIINRALRADLTEARIDGKMVSLVEDMRLERHKLHNISLLVGSVTLTPQTMHLLETSLEQALLLGQGTVEVSPERKDARPETFSIDRVCPKCKRGFHKLDPQIFSFRSSHGCCSTCGGRGVVGDSRDTSCPSCSGARIGPLGRSVVLGGKRIFELSKMTAPELRHFFESTTFDARLAPIFQPILVELLSRLRMMENIGLDYLSLDRDASTLSGGEAQRLRLVRTLGSPLTGVCYVLDEPTIGLHPTDHAHLLHTLRELRDEGNTVLVVEHDEETILAADHVIDIGPSGGASGGKIVAQGSVTELVKHPTSVTAKALRERLMPPQAPSIDAYGSTTLGPTLILSGAKTNNLKNIRVNIPLGKLTAVAGVSGSGKSSLVHGTLVPALLEDFDGKTEKQFERSWKTLKGADQIARFLEIDQAPIGRTPSSTPASYLGIFDDIRKIFASLPEAKAQGWSNSHFSFNTKGGRCEACSGRGYLTIPMSFLPDATTLCEECLGMRYDDETLQVKFQNISIGEVLKRTFDEARSIFSNHRKIVRSIDYVIALGLGYLTLGQPTNSLSGGEAQRIKIATELGSSTAVNTLYILDEPTTGLHMTDVDRLVNVLEELVHKGNTVIVIEHNLDVIRRAQYLIEMGPGPGNRGGEVVYAGEPSALLAHPVATPTKRALSTLKRVLEKPLVSAEFAVVNG